VRDNRDGSFLTDVDAIVRSRSLAQHRPRASEEDLRAKGSDRYTIQIS
jgi:hypothetical protein